MDADGQNLEPEGPPAWPPERPARGADGWPRRLGIRLVQGVGMAAAVAVGAAALMLLPRPHRPAPPLPTPAEARPAPDSALPASPAPAAAVARAPSPAPPLRLRRLVEAPAPPRPALPVVIHGAHPRPPEGAPERTRERAPQRLAQRAAAPRMESPCRAPTSEADRLVCTRPAIAALDRQMRAAYDRALAGGADRLEIDRGQARWRAERDRAAGERRIAGLYARRIADLAAASRRPARRGE
jgi:hypothetical protein